ncbi:MAG: anti-sigma factor [Bacteroidota bacterium]
MDKEKIISSGLLEQYVLGLLDSEEDRIRVEHYAELYPEVGEHIRNMQKSMEDYALSYAIPAPKNLKQKVLKRIEATDKNIRKDGLSVVYTNPSANHSIRPIFSWLRGAAVLLILGLSSVCWSLYKNQQTAQAQIAQLSQQMEDLRGRYRQLADKNQSVNKQFVLLKDQGTQHVHLRGSNIAPGALAVVYWNEDHQNAYLNLINMPPPPHGHQYQVWADVNGKHKNMGLLDDLSPSESDTLHGLNFIKDSRGFVITLEKTGGSPHPTVEKMFVHGEL